MLAQMDHSCRMSALERGEKGGLQPRRVMYITREDISA